MVDGQRTDDRPWLYYKLTNEPKGSGELKTLKYMYNPKIYKHVANIAAGFKFNKPG